MSSRTGAGGCLREDRRTLERGRAGAGRRTGGHRAEDRADAGQRTGGRRVEDGRAPGGGQGGQRTEDRQAPGGGRAGAGRMTRRAQGGGQGGRRRTGGLRAEDRWYKTHNNQREKAPTTLKDERKAGKKKL